MNLNKFDQKILAYLKVLFTYKWVKMILQKNIFYNVYQKKTL